MRVLVVRNDKLGDFMLSWPTFAIIKHYWPEATLCALVPDYTRDMANLCPWIDEVIIDKRQSGFLADILFLTKTLRAGRFDAIVTLFSTSRVGIAACLSRIAYRLAPATKLIQLCYPQRLRQKRSRSEKPEYAYNIDLAYHMLHEFERGSANTTQELLPGDYLPAILRRPLLAFDTEESARLRASLCSEHQLNPQSRLIFIHPGSGGSASRLTPSQYAELANRLQSKHSLALVITAGPGEEPLAREIAAAIDVHPVVVLSPRGGVAELARHLQLADLFISGSTGPLHIAGALNRPTATFYPRHRSGSPQRWQTLNEAPKRLVFTPPEGVDEKDVSSIDVITSAEKISTYYLQ